MFRFKIIENNDKEWQEIISKSKNYDFYHTSIFHKIDNTFTSVAISVILNALFEKAVLFT